MEKSLKLSIDPSGAKTGSEQAAKYAKEAADAAKDAQSAFKKLSQLIAKTNTTLGKATRSAGNTGKAFDRLKGHVREANKEVKGFQKSVGVAGSSMRSFGGILTGVGMGFLATETLRAADEYTNLSNRLAVVSKNGADIPEMMSDLVDVSADARTSLEGTVDVFSKLTRATDGTNVSQRELLDITTTVSKAAAMGATSVTSTNASLLQFGQAMSNNWQASAQEMNSIIEQTPGLAKAMADGLTMLGNFGTVQTGNLKKLGEAGLLSTELMMEALRLAAESVEKDHDKATVTIAQGWLQVQNALILVTGESKTLKILTSGITSAFVTLAEVMRDNVEIIDAVFKGMLTLGAGGAAVGALMALRKAYQGVVAMQIAWNTAMKLNPIFLLASVVIGVSAALYTYLNLLDDEVKVRSNISKAIDGNTESLEALNSVERKGALMRLDIEKSKLRERQTDQENYSAKMSQLSDEILAAQKVFDLETAISSGMKFDQMIEDSKTFGTTLDPIAARLTEIAELEKAISAPATPKKGGLSIQSKSDANKAARKKKKAEKALQDMKDKINKVTKAELDFAEAKKQTNHLVSIGTLSLTEQFNVLDEYRRHLGLNLTATEALQKGFSDYAKDVKTQSELIADVTTKAFQGMEDALVEFTKTGKLSFSDMANSIVEDMLRMQIQESISKPLSSGISSLISGGLSSFIGGGSANVGASQAGYSSSTMDAFFSQSAKGNVFGGAGKMNAFAKGGVPSLKDFSNSIVDKPTMFAAGGTPNNLMGEAGAEAILPLTRTSSGNLGVETTGSGSGPSTIIIPITIPVSNASEEGTERTTQQGQNGSPDIEVIVTKIVKSSVEGGSLDRPLRNRFGISPKGA